METRVLYLMTFLEIESSVDLFSIGEEGKRAMLIFLDWPNHWIVIPFTETDNSTIKMKLELEFCRSGIGDSILEIFYL